MTAFPPQISRVNDTPIAILNQYLLGGRFIVTEAVNAYGRHLVAMVPWQDSTLENVDRALRRSWRSALALEYDAACARYSFDQEIVSPDVAAFASHGLLPQDGGNP